jgi:multidrug efflux pump subunit AcrA (membrane-fusion protein)
MLKNKKKLKIALIIYIALMLVVVFFSRTIHNATIPRVSVAAPHRGTLTHEFESFGFTEFADTFSSHAEIFGQIEEMLVQVGDFVRQGEPIARFRTASPDDEPFILRSLADGIVISVHKENGAFTNIGERVATMGVANNQFYTIFTAMPEEVRFFEPGDTAELTITGYGRVQATVSQMSFALDGRINIRLDFEADKQQSGQFARINIRKQSEVFDRIVPNEAIIREGLNSYVWAVTMREGTLGREYFSVRVRVIIADSDDFHSAIARGMEGVVTAGATIPVIVNSDRDLSANGRVRRME